MPAQHGVHVFEQPGANHIELASAAFLRRRAVEPDSAGDLLVCEPVFDGDCGKKRCRTQEIVAAAMSRAAVDTRFALSDTLLGKTRQSIVLAHDSNHRLAMAPCG